MDLASWTAFRFFDVFQVRLRPHEQSTFAARGEITAITAGSDNSFAGAQVGQDAEVRIFSSSFHIIKTFLAYTKSSIRHIKQIDGTSHLVTIAEDLLKAPILKVWALDTIDKKTDAPVCLSTIEVGKSLKLSPVTAFVVLDSLSHNISGGGKRHISQVAIGFGNGNVSIIRGDFLHDRGARTTITLDYREPITGLKFRDSARVQLCISTVSRIILVTLPRGGMAMSERTISKVGCDVGCMTIEPSTDDIVVGRTGTVSYYALHRNEETYLLRGSRKSVSSFGQYLVVISSSPHSSITIMHRDLKFIALQDSLTSEIETVFSESGDLFVKTEDGKIYRYHERTVNQRLDALFQRNFYVLATELARTLGLDEETRNIIHRKFGDYLYNTQDYSTAMERYLIAIKCTEPSQVIRKYLDAQRIHNLIEYLEELHNHHLATAEHTTLLLNCYAKLKDVGKLDKFLESPGDLKFDLDTAISMCRQGGYYKQAASLACKFKEHDIVIDILVADSKEYADAVTYICCLKPDVAYRNMIKFAPVLLDHRPKETTQFFIDFYTGIYKPNKKGRSVPEDGDKTEPINGVIAPNIAISAVQSLASIIPLPYMSLGNAGSNAEPPKETILPEVTETIPEDPPIEYVTPRPRTAFSAFLNHPSHFTTFLEACARGANIEGTDKEDVYTTLLEMYLHQSRNRLDEKTEWEAKAKALIDNPEIPIQKSNILLLSDLENYQEGTTIVREQEGLQFDIFRSYTAAKDTPGAIRMLRKYGRDEPQLYPLALKYFTSSSEILAEAGDEVGAVLDEIDTSRLMAPLQVIQMLSASQNQGGEHGNVTTIGLIKPYLTTVIARQQHEIAEKRQQIELTRQETTKNRTEIEKLSNEWVILNANKCSTCNRGLELPVVHFLCKHSFHTACLNSSMEDGQEFAIQELLDRDLGLGLTTIHATEPSSLPSKDARLDNSDGTEGVSGQGDQITDNFQSLTISPDINPVYQGPRCPLCEAGNEAIRRKLRIRHRLAQEGEDTFFSELKNSKEPVGTVAKWFGEGIL